MRGGQMRPVALAVTQTCTLLEKAHLKLTHRPAQPTRRSKSGVGGQESPRSPGVRALRVTAHFFFTSRTPPPRRRRVRHFFFFSAVSCRLVWGYARDVELVSARRNGWDAPLSATGALLRRAGLVIADWLGAFVYPIPGPVKTGASRCLSTNLRGLRRLQLSMAWRRLDRRPGPKAGKSQEASGVRRLDP